jgi:hypothetical protein
MVPWDNLAGFRSELDQALETELATPGGAGS